MNRQCLAKPQTSTTATEVALQDAGRGLGHHSMAQDVQPLPSHFPLLSSVAEEAGGASDWEPSFVLQLACAKWKMRAEQRKCERQEKGSADLGGHLSFSGCSDPSLHRYHLKFPLRIWVAQAEQK